MATFWQNLKQLAGDTISSVNLMGMPDKTGLPTVVQNNNLAIAAADLIGGIVNSNNVPKPIAASNNKVPTTAQPKPVLFDTTNNGISSWVLFLAFAAFLYFTKKGR